MANGILSLYVCRQFSFTHILSLHRDMSYFTIWSRCESSKSEPKTPTTEKGGDGMERVTGNGRVQGEDEEQGAGLECAREWVA